MDLGDAGLASPLVLLVVFGGALVLTVAASMTWWQRRRVARSSVSTAAPEAVRQGSGGFEQSLRTLHAAGRWDEVLLRLLPAMQEARAGLTELVLAGSGGDQLRRAEGLVRALAATARELKEFEPGPTAG